MSAQSGINDKTKEQRKIIFGRNEIDIEAKSTIALLVDEVNLFFFFFVGLYFRVLTFIYRSFIRFMCFK